MDVLIMLGTTIAYVYSAVVVLRDAPLHPLFRGERSDHHLHIARKTPRVAGANARFLLRSKSFSSCSRGRHA
jgi:hypothetical protein